MSSHYRFILKGLFNELNSLSLENSSGELIMDFDHGL